MAATLKRRLFFAGEATSKLYPATAHGAHLSGVDVAKRVIATSEKREAGEKESASESE